MPVKTGNLINQIMGNYKYKYHVIIFMPLGQDDKIVEIECDYVKNEGESIVFYRRDMDRPTTPYFQSPQGCTTYILAEDKDKLK